MKFLLAFLLFFNLSATSIFAAEIPIPVQKNLSAYNLIGSAPMTFMGLKVYDAALWSENKEFSYDRKFAVHIKYNMNFTKENLAERSIDEIEETRELSSRERREYLQKLNEIFVNIKKGDEKVALFDPKNGVILFYNNQKIGEISNLKFARYFVDIWLDEKGSHPKVTKKLLGKSNEKNS